MLATTYRLFRNVHLFSESRYSSLVSCLSAAADFAALLLAPQNCGSAAADSFFILAKAQGPARRGGRKGIMFHLSALVSCF